MALTWLLGYVLAAGLLWGGLSKHNKLRASSKQLSTVVGAFVLLLMIAITLDDLFHWWSKFPKELIGGIGILIILERSCALFARGVLAAHFSSIWGEYPCRI